MTRSVLVLLAALTAPFAAATLAGCSGGAPEPRQPAFVVAGDDPPVPEPVAIAPADPSADDVTRERALRVMANEQRAALAQVASESRFVRVSLQDRVRNATADTERELDAIDRAIARLEREDMDASTRRERHDEIKARLRRIATRVSLMENAIRGQ
ncbi:MAG: hypothetical protein JST00_24435 [Deltaproteobacteria bacterium]|nr:hypothetical protein [Deltaproteobacteria bacterium]